MYYGVCATSVTFDTPTALFFSNSHFFSHISFPLFPPYLRIQLYQSQFQSNKSIPFIILVNIRPPSSPTSQLASSVREQLFRHHMFLHTTAPKLLRRSARPLPAPHIKRLFTHTPRVTFTPPQQQQQQQHAHNHHHHLYQQLHHLPRAPLHTTRPTIPHHHNNTHRSHPTTMHTTSRRRMANKEQNEEGGDDVEFERSAVSRKRSQLAGPVDPRKAMDHTIPEHLRGSHGWFRKGFDVPRVQPGHWLNRLVFEPLVALRGHYIAWQDTNVRLTRLGFTLFQLGGVGLFAAAWYYMGDYAWGDISHQLEISQKLYMLDVARILWARQAMRNAELVMNARPNGIPPGLTMSELSRGLKERNFHMNRPDREFVERAEQLNAFYAQQQHDMRAVLPEEDLPKTKTEILAEKRAKMSRMELQEEFEEMQRKQQVFDTKRRDYMWDREEKLSQDKNALQDNIQASRQNFKKQYVLSQVHVDI